MKTFTTRTIVTIVSFVAMLGASAWVVASNWPAGGMPWLAWQAHALALGTVIIETWSRAAKIQMSARAMNLQLDFRTALRVCLGGDFAAAITPARSGAEPARFVVLGESGMNAAGRMLILFLELFLEMLSLAIVCVLLALVFAGRGASIRGLIALVAGYSGAVLTVGAVALLLSRHNTHGPPPRWARMLRIGAGPWRALQRTLRQLRRSVTMLRDARVGVLFGALALSVVHLLCKVAALPALVYLGDRTFPLSMTTLAPLVLWPLALFFGGVVVPVPGGGGFIEAAFAATLSHAIPAKIFAASLIWWRFYTFYLYVAAGGLAAGTSAIRAIRGGHAPSTQQSTPATQHTL